MKMNQPQTRKLVVLLSALACLVVLVVILDSMPKSRPVDLPQDITELPQDSDTTDTTASDTNSDTVTELPSSEDISPSVTDTDSTESVTEESIADSTDVPLSNGTETVPPNTVTQPSLLLTFLGECAPGSPLGTTAYGSLNAKIAAEGVDDFWSDILPLLQEDDYTIASNPLISLHLSHLTRVVLLQAP